MKNKYYLGKQFYLDIEYKLLKKKHQIVSLKY